MAAIALFQPYSDAAAESAALQVLRSGQIASGPLVGQFEAALSAWVGLPEVVTTNDMSHAMMLALHVLGVGRGAEVLTAAYTCMSSVAPIANLGAVPRWVDVHASTGLMDPAALEARITSQTRACVLYHAAGQVADAQEIAAICKSRGVALVEDCNTALGARLHGLRVGSYADAAIYSFYPNRQVNALEGGAVTFRHSEQADRARRLRRFGIATSGFRDGGGEIDPASDIREVGWSASLVQLHAAFGLAQMDGLAQRLAFTERNAEWLTQRLADVPGVRVVMPGPGSEPSRWALLVLCDRRDAVLTDLKQRGVMASKLHHRLDTYTGLASEACHLPGTEAFLKQVIALPCGYWLSFADLERVAASLTEAIRAAA